MKITVAVGPLLQKFHHLFQEPQYVPLERDNNHQIHIKQGTGPLNVKPYPYPYFSKQEIEKPVTEMLATEIIRHNTKPFSPPVLLLEKKDGSWHFLLDYKH